MREQATRDGGERKMDGNERDGDKDVGRMVATAATS